MAAAVVTGWGFGGAAGAAYIYDVSLTGQVTSQIGGCVVEPENSCVDANIHSGDPITLTARFTSANVEAGDPTSNTAGLYGLPVSGPFFWQVQLDGLTWNTRNDIDDGDPFYFGPDGFGPFLGEPSLSFSNGHVTALHGYLSSTTNEPALPVLSLSGQCIQTRCNRPSPTSFTLEAGKGLYGDNYSSTGFYGTWDFADSVVTVSAAPEPAAWALSILGFGLMGAALRRRRRLAVI